jgi:hypothetical protein
MVYFAILAGVIVGAVSIASACYRWVRNQSFGTAGIVLSIIGIILFGSAVWASVEFGKPADSTALQRTIEDGNAKTIAAVRESNKQLADQLQRFTKQLQDNQDRALSDIQKHLLAIRTALAERERPAQTQPQQPPPNAGASAGTPKRQPPKTR